MRRFLCWLFGHEWTIVNTASDGFYSPRVQCVSCGATEPHA